MTALREPAGRTRASAGRLAALLPGALMAILFLGIALRVLGYELRADEQLYIPPAALLGQYALYEDIFYNHTPYSAWYFRALYLILPGDHLVLAARLGIVLAWAITLWGIWAAVRALSGDRMVALTSVVAVAANIHLLTVPGMTATNNFLQIGPAFGGLALFVLAISGVRRRALAAFGAGVCLSIAVGVKISSFVLVPPLAIAAFLLPWHLPFRERLVTVTLPMAVGGLLAAAPLFAMLMADPDLLIAHVAGYHTGPHLAYWDAMRYSEPGVVMGLSGKLRLAVEIWLADTNLLILSVAAIVLALLTAGRERLSIAALVVTLTVTVIVMAASFLPTPSFPQYFVLPIIGFVLIPAILWRGVPPSAKPTLRLVLAGLVGTMFVLSLPRIGEALAKGALGAPMTHQRVEAAGQSIRDALCGEAGRIATLSPVYPLEAGLAVYPEFATGPFGYRVMPMGAPDDTALFAVVGPDGVAALLDAEPPAAVLTGFAPDLEAPFVAWAKANGYRPDPAVNFSDRYGDAVLWVPEAALSR